MIVADQFVDLCVEFSSKESLSVSVRSSLLSRIFPSNSAFMHGTAALDFIFGQAVVYCYGFVTTSIHPPPTASISH